MKVHIIKASPRGSRAGSSHCADALRKGLEASGAEVTEVMLKNFRIEECTGCYSCWTKTPGTCIHRDDMAVLLEKERAADVVVFATPLYIYSVPGKLKTYLDRRIARLEPFLVPQNRGKETSHPVRQKTGPSRRLLISTAGFPEPSSFDALELMFRKCLDESNGDTLDCVFIGGAEMLYRYPNGDHTKAVLTLFEKAGGEVAEHGTLSDETTSAFAALAEKRMALRSTFRDVSNAFWQNEIDEAASENRPSPLKDIVLTGNEPTCRIDAGGMESLMGGMAMQYNPKACPDLQAVYQFNFEDEHYFIVIQRGKARAYKGDYPSPDMTVIAPKQVWDSICAGTKSGEEALMTGEYRVEGDMTHMMKFEQYFGDSEAVASSSLPEHAKRKEETPTLPDHRGPIKLSGGVWITVAFIPWMIQWIWGSFRGDGLPFVASAVAALLLTGYHRITNRPTLFETGTLFYTVATALIAAFGSPLFFKWQLVFSHLFLGGLFGVSLAKKYSLTAEFIRFDYPLTICNKEAFLGTNRILTALWSGYYLAAVLLRILEIIVPLESFTTTVVVYGSLIPMFAITGWFQKWYPRKLLECAF